MSESKPKLVTRKYPFFKCNAANQQLFAVQEGVPSDDALSWSSCILSAVVSLLQNLEDTSEEACAALYLVQMAKAAIDSVEVSDE